jgi:hypothetical protein
MDAFFHVITGPFEGEAEILELRRLIPPVPSTIISAPIAQMHIISKSASR